MNIEEIQTLEPGTLLTISSKHAWRASTGTGEKRAFVVIAYDHNTEKLKCIATKTIVMFLKSLPFEDALILFGTQKYKINIRELDRIK